MKELKMTQRLRWLCLRLYRVLPFIAVLVILGMIMMISWHKELMKRDWTSSRTRTHRARGAKMNKAAEKTKANAPKRDIHIPWRDDPSCIKHINTFGRNLSLPLTYLLSFPRSGNSWIRYLIESATGIFTGSVYDDSRAKAIGFLGESEPLDSGRVIAVKTHAHSLIGWSFEERLANVPSTVPVILIIREPLPAISSFWSFLVVNREIKEKTYNATAAKESYSTAKFRKFTEIKLQYWREVNEDRLLWSKKLLVVFYENLLEDPMREVKRMLAFLNFTENPARLKCLNSHLDGNAKRTHTELDPFTVREKKIAAYYMSTVASMLKERTGQSIPHSYKDFIQKYTKPLTRPEL